MDINKPWLWHMTGKSLMTTNCRCIKNKWVFKIKHNCVYWVHLECEYSQLPGVNFSKNYSPVVINIIFCILLLTVLHFSYSAKIVNVEITFSYGDLKEEIYMECPIGKDDCIILNKCIYGFAKEERQYYKKSVKILKNLEFVGGNVDPCLYIKKIATAAVYIAL